MSPSTLNLLNAPEQKLLNILKGFGSVQIVEVLGYQIISVNSELQEF